MEGVTRSYRKLHNEELHNLYLFTKLTEDFLTLFFFRKLIMLESYGSNTSLILKCILL